MRSFFRYPTSKVFNQRTLILVNSTPFSRAYSSAMSPAPAIQSNLEYESIRNAALRKYGLGHLNLIWPKNAKSTDKIDHIEKNPNSISQMYGEADLSKLPIFQGGFINFGYWPNSLLKKASITTDERVACSKEMYKVIMNLANILNEYSLLEVGCGLGYGSTLISQDYKPQLVVGMDISPEQIARAKKYQVSGMKSGKLRFALGEAESMPFVNNSFDCVISVEAAQHFFSMEEFSHEVSRVLKPGGKLIMTSFFPTSKEGIDALNAIVPDYHIHGSQHTTQEIGETLNKYMNSVKIKSIGKNVWLGFSKWLDQIGYDQQWSKIWCALYEKGLIDYMIYHAETPRKNLSLNQKLTF